MSAKCHKTTSRRCLGLLPLLGRNGRKGVAKRLTGPWQGADGSSPIYVGDQTANDCLDIGTDLGSPVSLDYYDKAPFKFNGKIELVKVKYLASPTQVQEEKRLTDAPHLSVH